MQSACTIENVEKKEAVDEMKNVDFDNFQLTEWLRSPTEKTLCATIVEYPSEKTIHVDWKPHASEADEWTFFARLVDAHEYWLREIRRKHPKDLQRSYVAAGAKDRVRIIGTCLLDLCRKHKFLPLTMTARNCIRRKAARLSKKTKRSVSAPRLESKTNVWATRRFLPHLSTQELHTWEPLTVDDYQDFSTQELHTWEPLTADDYQDFSAQELHTCDPLTVDDYQERMEAETKQISSTSPARPQAKYPDLHETFEGVISQVKPGEKKQIGSCGHYTEAARSNDGNTVILTSGPNSGKFNIQKTLSRSTIKRDGWTIITVEAKYSRPVRFTSRDGTVRYSDVERETVFHLADEETIIVNHNDPKTAQTMNDLLSNVAPTTILLTNREKMRLQARMGDTAEAPTAPTVPNRISVRAGENTYKPNSCLGILTIDAWRTNLYHQVRIDPDRETFTIREKTYPIAQFRILTTTLDTTKFVGFRGRLTGPCLRTIASKLAYLQRLSPDTNTFDNLLEKQLPWLLGNIDGFTDEHPTLVSQPISSTY